MHVHLTMPHQSAGEQFDILTFQRAAAGFTGNQWPAFQTSLTLSLFSAGCPATGEAQRRTLFFNQMAGILADVSDKGNDEA
jgi:hypothetical protein